MPLGFARALLASIQPDTMEAEDRGMLNGVADLELVRIVRDQKDAHLYVQAAMNRVKATADRHGGTSGPFLDELWKLYAQRSPALGLWACLREGELVGHMLATIQQWDYEYVGWVNQIEFDVALARSEERRVGK